MYTFIELKSVETTASEPEFVAELTAQFEASLTAEVAPAFKRGDLVRLSNGRPAIVRELTRSGDVSVNTLNEFKRMTQTYVDQKDVGEKSGRLFIASKL